MIIFSWVLLFVWLPQAGAEIGQKNPWDGSVRIDPNQPHHFLRPDGSPLFILNKTAWHYFSQKNPQTTLDRALNIGANVIRVGLECNYYSDKLHLDAWPWGGTRNAPEFSTFNERYWDIVEERLKLAATNGIGVNLTLFTSLQLPDTKESFESVRPYLERVMARLARHPNIFCWEIHNEHTANPKFQKSVAEFLHAKDPFQRPVISSAGTTDRPPWPEAPWMDMAVVHNCTGSLPSYDLRDWYLAIARNLRVHGKPAFNNETGRERRHRNDDPVHRRKQLWISAAAGGYTTWHSWDGCEGIDDPDYHAPGQEFVAPFSRWWSAQQFWRVNPDFTCVQQAGDDQHGDNLTPVALASPTRDLVLVYLFTRQGGTNVFEGNILLRLPEGSYQVESIDPAHGTPVGNLTAHTSRGLHGQDALPLPPFTDDLVIRITRTGDHTDTIIPGTE